MFSQAKAVDSLHLEFGCWNKILAAKAGNYQFLTVTNGGMARIVVVWAAEVWADNAGTRLSGPVFPQELRILRRRSQGIKEGGQLNNAEGGVPGTWL